MAIVPVPEAAVGKQDRLVFGKNEIRFAGQAAIMETIAESQRVKALAEDHLRSCVAPPDAGHHPAADLGRNDISHAQESESEQVS